MAPTATPRVCKDPTSVLNAIQGTIVVVKVSECLILSLLTPTLQNLTLLPPYYNTQPYTSMLQHSNLLPHTTALNPTFPLHYSHTIQATHHRLHNAPLDIAVSVVPIPQLQLITSQVNSALREGNCLIKTSTISSKCSSDY